MPSNSNRNNWNAVSSLKKKRTLSLTPCCDPNNHQQFLERVKTYNSVKWFAKPSEVNPLLCARFGWECIQINTLQCTGCKSKITYKSNNKWNNNINAKITQSFLDNVRSAHLDLCIWNNNECNKSFEYLPMNSKIIEQQITDNIKTWIKTDNNAFYILPKINPSSRRLMVNNMNSNENKIWINYSLCCDIMLLSSSGWYLTTAYNNSSTRSPITSIIPYAQCKYCNRCISLQSYDYKRILTLLPEILPQHLPLPLPLKPLTEETEDKEEKEITINDNDNKFSASVILREGFSSSTLSLDISNQLRSLNISRLTNCSLFDTNSLLKQAKFIRNNDQNINGCMSISQSKHSSPSGSGSVFGSGFNNNNCSNLIWPKKSHLTEPTSLINSNKIKIKRKNKKRNRDQMLAEDKYDNDNDNNLNDDNRPKKRIKTQSKSINNDINSEQINKKKRKNRKRKTMDSDDDEDDDQRNINMPITKKRRISNVSTSSKSDNNNNNNNNNDNGSSVSTTVSISSSCEINNSLNTPINNKMRRRKRKRKFNDVFTEGKDGDDDEDDDIKSNNNNNNNRIIKRARIDTPIVATQAYFDPINSHYSHCPFIKKQKNNIIGWNYCLKLIPNDILYLKQLLDDSKKNNQAKSR